VGSQKTVVNGKVLKTVVIRITYCKKMDDLSKGGLEAGMAEINKVLREETIMKDYIHSTVEAVRFNRKAGMKSKWKINKLSEEVKATKVLTSVTSCLIAFF